MYKAIIDIGGYKAGEEVPEDKALLWLKMYATPPVEKMDGKASPKKEPEKKPEASSGDSGEMLDDYLNRNANVVVKNIEKDDLNKDTINKLIELEEAGKNRAKVMDALEEKLEGMV